MIKKVLRKIKQFIKRETHPDNSQIKKKNEEKEWCIQETVNGTGWNREYALEQIKDAKARVGITYKDYRKNKFYNIPPEKQYEEYQLILAEKEERKQKRAEEKNKNILLVVERTGWDYSYAENRIDEARKKTGIKSKDYVKYEFYNIPVELQEKEYKKIVKKKRNAKQKKAEKNEIVQKVMAKTGWTQEVTIEKIEAARKKTGCAYKEYLLYKFYELEEGEQDKYFLIHDSVKLAQKYDVDKKMSKILCDKELTNEHFSKYLRRPWCVNTKITFSDFCDKFAESKRIIYKPLHGNRGKGVEAYDIDSKTIRQVYDELKTFPEGVVEEYVVQHSDMLALSPSSVNTVRIVTISSNEKPVTLDGKYIDIAYAALRIGGGDAIVDNFHSGGMVAAVDLQTGKLITDAADMEGNQYVKHPKTGVEIKGFQVPYFKEAMKLVESACLEKKINGYLGWDIAITENGPVLIEINLRPGVVLLSTPYIAEKKGMKYVMEKYL